MANEKCVPTCGDCIHADVCKQVSGSWFSRENIAYCKGFKDRANYVEVVHGKWDKNWEGDNIVYCDQCYMPQDVPTPYCSSCGAKMDGDGNG